MGPQLLQQFTLMDNGVLQKLRKLQAVLNLKSSFETNEMAKGGIP
jgi:hypothetical protein